MNNFSRSFLKLIDFFIPAEVFEGEKFLDILQYRFISGLNLIALTLLPILFYVELSAVGFLSLLAWVDLTLYFSLILSLYFLSYRKSKFNAILVWLLGCLVGIFGTAWVGQGLFDANLMWLIIGPIAGIVFAGNKLGVVCYVSSVIGLIFLYLFNPTGTEAVEISNAQLDYRLFSVLVPLSVAVFFGAIIRYIINYTEKQLIEIREKFISLKVKQFENQKLVSLGSFSGGIAHEINNPLAIALGKLEQIERVSLNPRIENKTLVKQIPIIKKQLYRIAKIVGGLRNITKEESTRESFESFKVNELILETLSLYTRRIQFEGIYLELILCKEDPKVFAQKVLVSQAFMNLFENAVDAISNSMEKCIEVKTELKNGQILLSVKDTGPGVPEEIKDRIWDPFFTTKEVDKGVGLGLSITLSIVEKCHGELSLSGCGQGAEFVLSLPVQSQVEASSSRVSQDQSPSDEAA